MIHKQIQKQLSFEMEENNELAIFSEITAEFDRDKLSAALVAVSAAQIDPDIGWVQIQFSQNNKVVFSSVSHNLSIKYEFDVPHVGEGIFKVSGKQFSDYVKQLPQKKVQLKAELPHSLYLRCGRSSAKVQLVQDQSQSSVLPSSIGTFIRIKGSFFESWLASFKDFVCLDDSRFYANGALIWAEQEQENVSVFAVASDAYRLAKSSLNEGIRIECLDNSQVIVSKKILEEVKRICSTEPNGEFLLKWCHNELSFSVEFEGYTMSAKCIAGQYPPYEAAIPQNIHTEILLDLKAMQESVRRALIFADNNRVMKLHFENSLLTMASFTPGQKEGEEVIEIISSIESPFEVNYNGHFLAGILNVLSGSKATFSWESTNRPVKIVGEEQRSINVFYLLVPTRF